MRARLFGVPAILLAVLATLLTTAGTAAQASTGCGGSSSSFAATLPQVRPGQSGTYVMGLQKALAVEGYSLVGTGYYGERTRASVRDFQARKGIRDSGIVGSKTWQALVGRKPACATLNGRAEVPGFGIQPGDTDPGRLAALQDRLFRILPDTTLISEDHYGPQWQAAVRGFQRANGIKASGIVGPKTWRALNLVVSITGGWGCGC